jgi:hypothetical protein
MRVQLAARQEVIRAARPTEARRALGHWARLKRAWRGQRGAPPWVTAIARLTILVAVA